MPVVTYWSRSAKETGQSSSIVALSTYMAIEHNMRILVISTNFNDNTIENAFWDTTKEAKLRKSISNNSTQRSNFDTGVEGLIKALKTNRNSPDMVSDYTRVVFKERFDVMCSLKTKNFKDYVIECENYPQIIDVASKAYDLVIVDLSKYMPEPIRRDILTKSDIVIMNILQKQNEINHFIELREMDPFYSQPKIMVNIGRYDSFSKYNSKNITRYLKEKREILAVPYNTLFFEACSEATVPDYFVRLRGMDPEERNGLFVSELSRAAKSIIAKVQELQMRL